MARTNLLVHSGNRIIVRLDGKTVGLIQSVRASDDFAPEPASGIGNIEAQEYVPTMARHTVNVSMMTLKDKTLLSEAIAEENGGDTLRGRVFDIEIFEKNSGKLLRKYVDCKYASGDVEVTKHAIVVTNAVFMALSATGKFQSV